MQKQIDQIADAKRTMALSPHRIRISTDAVDERERFSYWLDTICEVYARLDCERPETADVYGEIDFSRLGALDLTSLRSNVCHLNRTPRQIQKSSEDFCMVQVQREGRGLVKQDGREALLVPGDFVLYDATRPYELRFDATGHHVVVLRLPRATLEPHVGNLEQLTATTVAGSCAAGHLLLTMIESLQRDVELLHPSSVMGVSEGITSIIAAGLRSLPGANLRKASSLSSFHLTRVKAHVTEHLRDPSLSIASIAAAMRMSPDHLSRLFRHEPMPLSRMIWQQRLTACRRELADASMAHRSVSDIAFSWGFNEAAHFSRSFREQFGLSPREWRQAAIEGAMSPGD
jgi:AraC-like DNA-binding protein